MLAVGEFVEFVVQDGDDVTNLPGAEGSANAMSFGFVIEGSGLPVMPAVADETAVGVVGFALTVDWVGTVDF